MAIFHLNVKVIGRSQGRSAVAAAAYRSAEKIENEWDGITHDFTKKNWVEYSEIMLPENAPLEFDNRAILWNAVEQSEKSSDARLAREVEIALPKELTKAEQIQVLREFVQKKFVAEGMVADINVHNPPKTDDKGRTLDEDGNITTDVDKMVFQNPHAHILLTVRPMDKNGVWQAKTQKEYLLIREGAEKAFLSTEVKMAEAEGWEKQYCFKKGKRKAWLTKSKANELGLEQITRTPKATRFGRQNPVTEYWNSKDRIFEWRNSWASMCNSVFIKKEMEERIDARSFIDQGRKDELPTVHKGVNANNFDKRMLREGGKEISRIGQYNELIKEHNRIIRKMKQLIKSIENNVSNTVSGIKKYLEDLRIKIIGNEYQKRKMAEFIKPNEKEEYCKIKAFIKKREEMERKIAGARERSIALKKQLNQVSLVAIKDRALIKQELAKEQEIIELSEDVISSEAVKYGIDEMTYRERYRELAYVEKQMNAEEEIKSEGQKNKSEFKEQYRKLTEKEQREFVETNEYRQRAEEGLEKVLSDKIKLREVIKNVDKELKLEKQEKYKKQQIIKR